MHWPTLAAYVGPGFLVCIAYLDPGNLEADLQVKRAALPPVCSSGVRLLCHRVAFVFRTSACDSCGIVSRLSFSIFTRNFFKLVAEMTVGRPCAKSRVLWCMWPVLRTLEDVGRIFVFFCFVLFVALLSSSGDGEGRLSVG